MATVSQSYETLKGESVATVRGAVRRGAFQGQTAGLALGKLQANLAIVPQDQALDFRRFCERNPKPCPLVGISAPGDPMMRSLGADIDIRSDVPGYNVYRDGRLSESRSDISALWSDDLVAVAIGCSFTFERALLAAGISLWHIERNRTVPMYRTRLETLPVGPFGGGMVVSMRGIPADRVDDAVEISGRFPWAHGSPVHCGDPADIGIANFDTPDWGDRPELREGEVPVFWACGVTPQHAIMRAGLPLCITHKPGHMLITDIDDSDVDGLSALPDVQSRRAH